MSGGGGIGRQTGRRDGGGSRCRKRRSSSARSMPPGHSRPARKRLAHSTGARKPAVHSRPAQRSNPAHSSRRNRCRSAIGSDQTGPAGRRTDHGGGDRSGPRTHCKPPDHSRPVRKRAAHSTGARRPPGSIAAARSRPVRSTHGRRDGGPTSCSTVRSRSFGYTVPSSGPSPVE